MASFLLSLILPYLQAELAAKVSPPSASIPGIVAASNAANPSVQLTDEQFTVALTAYENWLEGQIVAKI